MGKTFTIKTPDYIKPYKSVGVKLLPELRSSPHGVFYTRLQSQSTDSGMPQPPSPLLTPFMKSEVPRNPQMEMGTNSLPTEQRDWRVLGQELISLLRPGGSQNNGSKRGFRMCAYHSEETSRVKHSMITYRFKIC